MKKIIYIGLFLLCCTSCEDEDTEPLSDDFFYYQYFPLQLGQEHVFQIDSILYDDFSGSVDTLSHQRREVVERTFIDNENREAFIVGIYQRADSSASWSKKEEIYRVLTRVRLEENNNNERKILLVFPVRDDKRWNSNPLNLNDAEEYVYANVHQPLDLNATTYDSTLTINQRDEQNFIERFFSQEKYATQTGLIYRKDISLRTDLDGTIRSGYNATLQLIEFKAGE